MHRLMDRLDKQLSVLVPLLYLLGTLAGTVYFFVGNALVSGFGNSYFFSAGVIGGVAIAVSVETHAYLQQRRFRAAWEDYRKASDEDENYEEVQRNYNTAKAWLIVLMGFEVLNGCAFWITFERPTTIFDTVMLLLRGVIVPILFLGSGYLTRMAIDAVEILSSSADKMLLQTMKAVGKQWKRRVATARRSGKNLASVAIALMEDAGESAHARRIALIENGLTGTETGTTSSRNTKSQTSSGQKTSPTKASVVKGENEGGNAPSNVVRLAGRGGYHVRRQLKEQERVFKFLNEHPDASIAEVRRGAKLGSDNTAIKYRKMWREMNGLGAVAEG